MPIPNFPAFDEISITARDELEKSSQAFRFPPAQTVIRIGDAIEGVYLIKGGYLRVYVQSLEGREKTLYEVRPGQACIFSINSAFSGDRYPAWVASGNVETDGILIPSDTYRSLFEQESVVRGFTVQVLSQWVSGLMTMLEESCLSSFPERLAHWLIRRADNDNIVEATHEALASDLGTAREVVTRCLRDFEKQGVIAKGRKKIEILDARALIESATRSEAI